MATAASTHAGLGDPLAPPVRSAQTTPPICVDLDGTLLRTDLLWEMLIVAVRRNPLVFVLAPFWLLRGGRAGLKAKLAALVQIDVALLPYHEPLIEFLREKKFVGHKLYLTSAANYRLAEAVANHVGLFDGVLASDEQNNLKGRCKLRAIRQMLGSEPFIYAGNAREDVVLWRECDSAITVNPPRSVASLLRREEIPVAAAFDPAVSRWKVMAKALRVYQWSKNILIFLPMLLAHAIGRAEAIPSVIAFVAFSLCASAFYLVNDLLDLEADRAHARKRKRPFASGMLSIQQGLGLLAATVAAAALLSLCLPPLARWLILLYAVLNLLYSVELKRELFLDVLILACFYTMRVLVGGAASGIPVSVWTLACSIFLFLGLALVKRLTELRRTNQQDRALGEKHAIARRAYLPVDISMIQSFAAAALYLSVLVLALYINSTDVLKLYTRPEALWMVCLLEIYWVSRLLMFANRGIVADDPIVFAFRDRVSYYVGSLVLACVVAAL